MKNTSRSQVIFLLLLSLAVLKKLFSVVICTEDKYVSDSIARKKTRDRRRLEYLQIRINVEDIDRITILK